MARRKAGKKRPSVSRAVVIGASAGVSCPRSSLGAVGSRRAIPRTARRLRWGACTLRRPIITC